MITLTELDRTTILLFFRILLKNEGYHDSNNIKNNL